MLCPSMLLSPDISRTRRARADSTKTSCATFARRRPSSTRSSLPPGAGRYEEAMLHLDAADGLFERNWALAIGPEGHKRRGNYHASQELHAVAMTDFDLALALDPTRPWAHFDLGVSLHAIGRLPSAL